MSNNYDTPILLDGGNVAVAAQAQYIGFGRTAGTAVSTGPRIFGGTGDPDTNLVAPAGSLYLSSDGGAGGVGTLFVADDAAGSWVLASAVV